MSLTGTGIGQAIAVSLAQAGARIILAQRDIHNTSTRDIVLGLKTGQQCDIVKCDLQNLQDVKEVFGRALAVVDEIHILVNCGGMLIRNDTVDVEEGEWNTVSATHNIDA